FGQLTLTVVLVAFLVVVVTIWQRGIKSDKSAVEPSTGLVWPEPDVDDVITISLDSSRSVINLDPKRDYQLVLPSGALRLEDGLTIRGGRNVVLRNGTIEVTKPEGGRAL